MTRAAERRTFAKAVLCFLDGLYLALLCLAVLPHAMGNDFFYGAAAAAALGVLAGLRTEGRASVQALCFALVTGCQLLWSDLSLQKTWMLAFFGGMGLYHASAGILPEKIEIGKALLSGAGFLVGTLLFAAF